MNEKIIKAFEGRWRIKSQNLENALEVLLVEYRVDYVKKLCQDFFEAGYCLYPNLDYDTEEYHVNKVKELNTRTEKFKQLVFSSDFCGRYPQQLLEDFFSYWSEPNRSNTKMRFELQKTWDIKRRLATWAKNDFNHYGTKQSTDKQQQQLSKLADILTD